MHSTLTADDRPWQQTLGLTLLLGALAVGGDWYAPTIFVTHSLVLGVVFYWIALHLIGPMPALFVLMMSTGTLIFKWGQIYSGLMIALEGLVIGWAWRRKRNPLLADVLFWLVIGTPVSWFVYRYVYPIPHPSIEIALALQPMNGLVAVWIAYVALEFWPQGTKRSREARPPPQQSTRDLLLKRYAIFGTFPLLIVVLVIAHKSEQRWVSDAKENLTFQAGHLAGLIGRHVANGTAIVRELAAGQREETWPSSADKLAGQLKLTRSGSDIFLTMLGADKTGRVLAASPSFAQGRGAMSVSDRGYFAIPMQTGRSFVSDVFQGRGFGTDLLVAISAPVISQSGERIGVIEGSIGVDALAGIIRAHAPDASWRWLLSDRQQRVVTTRGFDLPVLTLLASSPLGKAIERARTTPGRFTDTVGGERVSYLTLSVPVPDTDWTLTLQREWADVLAPIAIAYGWAIAIASITVLAAMFFVSWSVRDLLEAWRDLIGFSAAPVLRVDLLERTMQRNLPTEFVDFVANLHAMSQRLEYEKNGRQKLLAELESRVEARTRDLHHALMAAEAADRAKTAFLASVSHELRTPLTSIITGAALLEMHTPASSSVATRTLISLKKSSEVLLSVIGEVLDYSKLEASAVVIDAQRFRPAETIADVMTIMNASARAQGLILCSSPSYTTSLEWIGDEPRLRQVLLNLVGNAVKFTASGTVEISSWVTGGAEDTAQQLHIAVKDSGPGMPTDRLTSIFEPFVQLEENPVRAHAGTGLGLTISRRLVHLMGGDISVQSTMGKGSVFEFWISQIAVRGS